MIYRKRDFPNSTKRVAKNNDAVWRVPDVLVVDTSCRYYQFRLEFGI